MASLQDALVRTLLEEVQAGRGQEAYQALLDNGVKPEMFDTPNQEVIFFALHEKCDFTPLALAKQFRQQPAILSHIASLQSELDYPKAFYGYVLDIYQDWQNRALDRDIAELASLAPHLTYEEKSARLLGLRSRLDTSLVQSDLVSAYEASQQAMGIVDQFQRGEKDKLLLPTGYHLLDQKFDGMMRGEVMAFMGATGIGKSALANGIIQHCASLGYVCLVESLEMPAEVWMLRGAASNTEINQKTLIRQTANEQDYDTFRQSLAQIGELPIVFNRFGEVTLKNIAEHIAYAQYKYGRLDLLVVDYGRLIKHSNANPAVQATEIANGLKMLVRDTINDDGTKLAGFVIWDMVKKDNTPDFMPNKSDAMYGGIYTFADVFSLAFPYAYKDTHEGQIRKYLRALRYDEDVIDKFWLTEKARHSAICKIIKARNSQDNELFTGFVFEGEYTKWSCR